MISWLEWCSIVLLSSFGKIFSLGVLVASPFSFSKKDSCQLLQPQNFIRQNVWFELAKHSGNTMPLSTCVNYAEDIPRYFEFLYEAFAYSLHQTPIQMDRNFNINPDFPVDQKVREIYQIHVEDREIYAPYTSPHGLQRFKEASNLELFDLFLGEPKVFEVASLSENKIKERLIAGKVSKK